MYIHMLLYTCDFAIQFSLFLGAEKTFSLEYFDLSNNHISDVSKQVRIY